ncbi:hypothetical protein EDD86DRAFT_211707 [Gorgonomyces haynaldii]|nr:hypothetical protein EDD86DRAFT_211707 [Gorgonomyces haynaldii]
MILWHGRPLDCTAFANYMNRILVCTPTNLYDNVLLTALYYVYRLSQVTRDNKQPKSEYRVLVTALMLADSYLNDNAYSVKSWAQVSSFSPKELIAMRREFLNSLGYGLHLSRVEYSRWLDRLRHFGLFMAPVPAPLSPMSPPNYPYQIPVQTKVAGLPSTYYY